MKRILFVLVVLLLAGCANPTAAPGSNPYPGPNGVVEITATRTPMPRPGSTVGAAVGRLVSRSTGAPLRGQVLYLGELVPLTPGPNYTISMQQNSSPHVFTEADGYFGFSDVKPGSYGLILWSPTQSTVVSDPQDPTKEFRVEIKPGQITENGELQVEGF